MPLEVFMKQDNINNRTYFYYGDVEKIIVENDVNILLDNFDHITFEWVRYLNIDNQRFNYKSPNDHYNLILNLQNGFLNYYYSFPFTHKTIITNPQYYEHLSKIDLTRLKFNQYWRPYFSINEKKLVNISKFNLNPDNYMFDNNLRYRIYEIVKFYSKKF